VNDILECLIKRDGPTRVWAGPVEYTFTSRPELTGGNPKPQVCRVNSKEHREYLLRFEGDYRVYGTKAKRGKL